MKIIEIKTLDNGAHRNQTGDFKIIPEGFAVIPEDMDTPNFPFGEFEVEDNDIIETVEVFNAETKELEKVEKVVGTMKVVTKWTAGTIPEVEEPEQPENEPTNDSLTTDDFATAILEGVNEV